jgi:hypothetical protein
VVGHTHTAQTPGDDSRAEQSSAGPVLDYDGASVSSHASRRRGLKAKQSVQDGVQDFCHSTRYGSTSLVDIDAPEIDLDRNGWARQGPANDQREARRGSLPGRWDAQQWDPISAATDVWPCVLRQRQSGSWPADPSGGGLRSQSAGADWGADWEAD